MARGFTDIHCHVVYGIDDGPRTREESYAMLNAAHADGVRRLIATSHTCPGIQAFDTELYLRHVEELRAYCAGRGLDLKILTGSEILYSPQTCRFLREGRLLTLGESEYALVEFLPSVRYDELCAALEGILRSGYSPVVAHVERYSCLSAFPKRMQEIRRRYQATLQMNCSSAIGGKGWMRDKFARRALDEGLIDAIASDAHNTTTRPTRMRDAYLALATRYGEAESRRLTGVWWSGEENAQSAR